MFSVSLLSFQVFFLYDDFLTYFQYLSLEKLPDVNFPEDRYICLVSFVAIPGRVLAGAERCQGEMLDNLKVP